MLMLKEQIKKFKIKLQQRDRVYILIASLIVPILFFVDNNYLKNYIGNAMGIFGVIVFASSLFGFMAISGYVTLKSLFFVAAEISLVIFLAQSYLDIPNHPISSNGALKNLLVISLFYIIIRFIYSLFKDLQNFYLEAIEKEPWSKGDTFASILLIIFIGFYAYQIYLVVYPIIQNIFIKLG